MKSRLFAGVTTFAELEQRIANLPSQMERGDAFEVFAEAYLATQGKLYQVAEVWPQQAPIKVAAKLKLLSYCQSD